jgi:hypothetical protein
MLECAYYSHLVHMPMSLPQDPPVPPLSEKAVVIEGQAHNGRSCRLVDNTGTVARDVLEGLLSDLIESRRFGLSGLSAGGSGTIRLGAPEFTHIQLGDHVYRLILLPYEARLEVF